MSVTVVHLMDTLMNMQLDASGGQYLARKMEQIGVRVMTGRKTERLLGNGHVERRQRQGRHCNSEYRTSSTPRHDVVLLDTRDRWPSASG